MGIRTNRSKLYAMFFLLLLFSILKSPGYAKAAVTQSLNLNQTYTVKLENMTDSRLYEFHVPQAGNFQIHLKNTNPVGTQQISAQLYDSNNQPVTDSWKGSNIEMPNYSTKENRTFYLKLEGHLGIARTSFDLTVNFEPADDWEMEDNNTPANATPVLAGKPVYGAINDLNDDCDYFQFHLDSAKNVSVTFGPKEVSGEKHLWKVFLLDSDNHSIEIYRDSVTKTYRCRLKKGTYYIKAEDFLDSKNIAYSLSFEESDLKLEPPSISSLKATGHNRLLHKYVELNDIKIKNAGTAAGYTVKVAKKKNMKGNLVTENIDFDRENSKKKVSLKAKLEVRKAYYLQARSYLLTPFQEKIYGKYGAVKEKKLKDSLYKQLKK